MYHPQAPPAGSDFDDDDYEFIELANSSDSQSIDLLNYSFTQGIEFTFAAASLAPHERVVAVRNEAAFRERYGQQIRVVGQYGVGDDDFRLSNAGEAVSLVDAGGQILQHFTYDDAWYPQTDGGGYSLEIRDLTESDPSRWNERVGWQTSRSLGGSPGSPSLQGDFDENGRLGAGDIDRLFTKIRSADDAIGFDLTDDSRVDQADVDHLVTKLLGTQYGDTDLDGDVDRFDIITALVNVSGSPAAKTWSDGDFDGDGDVDEDDLNQLSNNFSGARRVGVIISEFLASNNDSLTDGDGDSSDWVELYNGGNAPVTLEGYRLTDRADNLSQWTFPDVTIEPGGYLLVFASGADSDNRVDAEGNLHASFTLSAEGDYLALIAPSGRIVSEFGPGGTSYPPQRTDVSYGISQGTSAVLRTIGYMVTPTPGTTNTEPFVDFVADTTFSVDRGYYEAPFEVEITTSTPGAEIRYTTDGSSPSPSTGTVYAGPTTINATTTLRAMAFKPGYVPTNVDTQSYLFFDSVLHQTKPTGYPDLNADNYDVDPDVVLGPIYHERFLQGLASIPTLSLVLQQDAFVGPRGIYTNPQLRGMTSERPVSAELINPDGTPGFQIDAGVRIQGGASRSPDTTPKHSMSLRFRQSYGAGRLEYPLFPNSPVTSFDSISLRGGSNNSWGVGANQDRRRATYIRDQYIRDALIDMGNVDAGRGIYVHLYVNGLYWGLYNLTERVDAAHLSEYFGGEPEDYDARNGGQVLDGSAEAFNEMQEIAKSGDWDAIQRVLDVDNFIDFSIITTYGANGDIASTRNHRSAGGGPNRVPWRLYSWDAEEVFYNPASFGLGADPLTIFRDLQKLEEFRVRYGDRVHEHFFNDGALTTENAVERWLERMQEIDLAIIGESARWGDYRRPGNAYSRDTEWMTENIRIIKEHLPLRANVVLDIYRDLGLYPDVVAPTANQHGGLVSSSFGLRISAPAGVIYYALDGDDPRSPGGGVSEHAVLYNGPLTFAQDTTVKSRVLVDGQWSALTKADFTVGSDLSLRVTEINYQPHDANLVGGLQETDADNDEFEFIELTNVGDEPIDLAGVRFVPQTVDFDEQGILFTFASQSLAPGARIVVVRDREAFQSRYGTTPRIAAGDNGDDGKPGEYDGKLANSGEQLSLLDANGVVIQMFDYSRAFPQASRAAGLGSSLEVASTSGDYNDPTNWRPSSDFGGSPGTAGLGLDRRVIVNELLAHSEVENGDWIELQNTSADDIDLGKWYLSNSGDELLRFQFPAPATIAAGGFHVVGRSELGYDLSETFGGNVWLIETDATGRPTRFVDHVQFGTTDVGVSVGRSPIAEDTLSPLAQPTPGSSNSARSAGVFISEIHFNAPDPDGPGLKSEKEFEFIELHNPTSTEVDLSGWRVTGNVELTLEEGTTIGVGQSLVVVGFQERRVTVARPFRERYGLDGDFSLFGEYVGILGNASGSVRLERPTTPPSDKPYFTPYTLVDEVRYGSAAPWPSSPQSGDDSIMRISPVGYGNLAESWTSGTPTPGAVEPAVMPRMEFDPLAVDLLLAE